jgi:hypothetical protein
MTAQAKLSVVLAFMMGVLALSVPSAQAATTVNCGVLGTAVITNPSGPGLKLKATNTTSCTGFVARISASVTIFKPNATITASGSGNCTSCTGRSPSASETGIPSGAQRFYGIISTITFAPGTIPPVPLANCGFISFDTVLCQLTGGPYTIQ